MDTAVRSHEAASRKNGAVADRVLWGFIVMSVLAFIGLVLSATSALPEWTLSVFIAGFAEAVMAACIAWIAREMLG